MERIIKKILNQPAKKTEQQCPVVSPKKKRFSLILLKSAIEPTNKPQEKRPALKYISKSTSFLQLTSFTSSTSPTTPDHQHYRSSSSNSNSSSSTIGGDSNSSNTMASKPAATAAAAQPVIKRSRSMFSQFASFRTNSSNPSSEDSVATAVDQKKEIMDYYNSGQESDILHTAAVSICSSTFGTVNSNRLSLQGGSIGHHNQSNCLQLGIQSYEKGELENATHYWRMAAEENEMLAVFLYGLALRHGWGCRKSPAIALRYLQKTTSSFTPNELQSLLSRSIGSSDTATVDTLACSIYELGEFFWHGWEVPKSVIMATYYFQLAAGMGNANAMNSLGFCFKHGHGVAKDDHQAAKLYRKAARQGLGLDNNLWIWDSQYDHVDNNDNNVTLL